MCRWNIGTLPRVHLFLIRGAPITHPPQVPATTPPLQRLASPGGLSTMPRSQTTDAYRPTTPLFNDPSSRRLDDYQDIRQGEARTPAFSGVLGSSPSHSFPPSHVRSYLHLLYKLTDPSIGARCRNTPPRRRERQLQRGRSRLLRPPVHPAGLANVAHRHSFAR